MQIEARIIKTGLRNHMYTSIDSTGVVRCAVDELSLSPMAHPEWDEGDAGDRLGHGGA